MVYTEYLKDGSITPVPWRANQRKQGLIDISINIGSNNHRRETAAIREQYTNYLVENGIIPW